MIRRLIVLLTALAALACAPSADAFVSFVPAGVPFGLATSGNGTFGPGNGNTFTINAFSTIPFGTGGTLSMSATDASGEHSYTADVDCVSTAPPFTDAGILAHLETGAVGEPATLYGVLIHVTDPEPDGTIDGTGDKIDVTNLNQKQYQRQLAAGCLAATGKRSISSGNIAVALYLPSGFIPFPLIPIT